MAGKPNFQSVGKFSIIWALLNHFDICTDKLEGFCFVPVKYVQNL